MTPRPFTSAHFDGVNALHRDVWWPERSEAGWTWLEANPARQAIDAASGWVVETEAGVPAAFVGNLIQRFWEGGEAFYGATGFSIIVPPEVRGSSRALIRMAVRQPDVFGVYTFNANSRSAPLYARHGMNPWPTSTHALKLSWIIDPIDCLHGMILREAVKRAPGLTDPYRERFMNRRLGAPRTVRLPSQVSVLSDFDDGSDYDRFWQALKSQGRLIADRGPEILRWRLADPDQRTSPVTLAFRRDDAITGYAMALMTKATPIDPAVLEILDIVALDGEAEAIPALMRAVMAEARALGAAKVRLQVVGEDLLARLGPWAKGGRREGGWGHCHAVFHANGPEADAWSPTPFDGDYAFCQRPVPTKATPRDPVDRARTTR